MSASTVLVITGEPNSRWRSFLPTGRAESDRYRAGSVRLAAVFGLDGTATTICYAATAGQLLDAAVERGAPG